METGERYWSIREDDTVLSGTTELHFDTPTGGGGRNRGCHILFNDCNKRHMMKKIEGVQLQYVPQSDGL